MLVVAIAAIIRLVALVALPLIITNDGVEYLDTATRLWQEGTLHLSSSRPPAYPLLLAGTFQLLGASAPVVLLLNHLLGCLACGLAAWIGCRLAGPRCGWIAGVLLALDPWLLMFESYALTEAAAVLFVFLAIALALGRGRIAAADRAGTGRTIVVGLAVGLALGAACLTRPALQAIVPFFALAWMLAERPGWRSLLLRGVLVVVGFCVLVVPWLQFNAHRGVKQVVGGLAAQQWSPLAQFGIVDWSYPVDPEIREEYERRFKGGNPGGYALQNYLEYIGAFDKRADEFRRWSRYSIIHNFDKYMHVWVQALAWQLNWIPDARLVDLDQLNWYVGRLGKDGSGFQFEGDRVHRLLADFESRGRGGPLRWFMRWWSKHRIPGIPQIPLFVLTLLTILVAALRRHWALALVLTGTVVFLLAHVTLLKSPARYALPAWTAWYITVVALPALFVRTPRPASPENEAAPTQQAPSD